MSSRIPSDHAGLVPAAKNSFKTSKSPFQLCKHLAAAAGRAGGTGGSWCHLLCHLAPFSTTLQQSSGGFSQVSEPPGWLFPRRWGPRLYFPHLLLASLKTCCALCLLLPTPSSLEISPGHTIPESPSVEGGKGCRWCGATCWERWAHLQKGGWPRPWEVLIRFIK